MAAVCAALFFCAASAAQATQRYAAPNGAGTACNQYSPCTIQTAFTGQNNGDEIIITSGDYGPVSQNLNVQTNTYAHGVHGQPAPRIHLAPGFLVSDSGNSARLSYVQIEGSTPEPLDLDASAEGDQLFVHATNNNACIVYGTLIDSVCWTSGTDDAALDGATNAGSTNPVLRNVTAEATSGSSSNGINYHTSGSGHITITAVNLIIHGNGSDIQTAATLPATAVVNTDHSNFVSDDTTGSGADVTATSKKTTPPVFVNAAGGDFREARTSPTIDFGVTNPLNGPYDFLGKPRTINGLTDIGADEFDPFDGVSLSNQNSKVKKRRAKVAIGCPAGTPTSCEGTIALTSGKKTAGSTSFSLPTGAAAILKVKITKKAFKKLAKRRKLVTQATATATDGAGIAGTATARIKLKS